MGSTRVTLVTRGAVVSLAVITAVACSSDDESGTSGGEGSGGTASTTHNGAATSTDAGGSSSGGSGPATTGPGAGGSADPNVTSSGGNGPSGGTGVTDGSGATDVGGSGGDSAETSGGGSAGAGGSPTTVPASCETPPWNAADFGAVYDVGPEQDYATPSEVPWETLAPGSLVRIHWRETPYPDKWVVSVAASEEEPVVVLGVPNAGRLPQIVGSGATTREELDYWSGSRGILKIGGSSIPDSATAEHVFVECLDLSGARAGNGFTNADGETEDQRFGNLSGVGVSHHPAQ